ncbi:hypothetical protein KCU98_g6685, partial [Aureobasidium melanogenum]
MKNRKAEKKALERPDRDTRRTLRAMTQSQPTVCSEEEEEEEEEEEDERVKAADELKDEKATSEGSRVTARV